MQSHVAASEVYLLLILGPAEANEQPPHFSEDTLPFGMGANIRNTPVLRMGDWSCGDRFADRVPTDQVTKVIPEHTSSEFFLLAIDIATRGVD